MGQTSISAFAKRLPSIVEIKSSRRTPPNYTSIKSTGALEAELRRGIRESSSKDYLNMLDGLLGWRFAHVDPRWGFGVSGLPHLFVTPKKPIELIQWIDARIKASAVSEDQIKQRYKKPVVAPPK
jgi:hypothetical protein